MKIPANVQAVIQALWATFPPAPTDESRRAFMRLVGEQLAFSVGPAWGWYKTEGSTGAPSKDLLPYVDPSGHQHGWDIISGATGALTLTGDDVTLYDAVFHPLAPVDHLGAAPPAPPPDDLAARVAALETALRDHAARIGELQAGLIVDDDLLTRLTDTVGHLPPPADPSQWEAWGKIAFWGVTLPLRKKG